MTFETKYNIGDVVYFLYKEQIVSENIYKISVSVEKQRLTPSINYHFVLRKPFFDVKIVDEEKCFTSKEELIKSL